MRIHGSRSLSSPPDEVFAAILDPRVLLAVIPGCRDVERTAPDEYEGRISLRLPGIVGAYRTHVRVVDAVEPERGGLEGRVDGALGTLAGRADFTLTPAPGGTVIEYDGTAAIDGPLARLDSRFMEQLARSLLEQGLAALDRRLAEQGLGTLDGRPAESSPSAIAVAATRTEDTE